MEINGQSLNGGEIEGEGRQTSFSPHIYNKEANMSDKEFTIPVVLDEAYMTKLNKIEEEITVLQEAIVELKKITRGTGFITGVNLDDTEG